MDWAIFLRWLHVLGACVLIGTGAGIAFFLWMARRSGNVALIAHTARIVVIADYVFTATAVVLQPITGVLLAQAIGWPLGTRWILLSAALYVLIGLCWLPVVVIQIRLRDLALASLAQGQPLGASFDRLFRSWVALGIAAFAAILAIVWLMLARPPLG